MFTPLLPILSQVEQFDRTDGSAYSKGFDSSLKIRRVRRLVLAEFFADFQSEIQIRALSSGNLPDFCMAFGTTEAVFEALAGTEGR